MQHFTGLEYLKIDIANAFGMDKMAWVNRIIWVQDHLAYLEEYVDEANEPMLYLKAVTALRKTERGCKSGHAMMLDATASGLQIMAALSGCKKTAAHVNMVPTGSREDIYTHMVNEMNFHLPHWEYVNRDDIKKPLMTHFYNKMSQDTLTDLQQQAFYNAMADSFTGAQAVMDLINQYWDQYALEHKWTLPDGHVARVKVTEMVNARIQVDELANTTFTYRFEANQPSIKSSSLVPNVIHSIDAYIAREMVRRADAQGFQLAHIHDAFCAHPNNMDKVRINYMLIMAEIADSNLLADILTELAGSSQSVNKLSNDLSKDIMDSEYMLS
jgi:hypothetical protein